MLAGILFEILIIFQILEQCAILRNTLLIEYFFTLEQTDSMANLDHSYQITPYKKERKKDDHRGQNFPESLSKSYLHLTTALLSTKGYA